MTDQVHSDHAAGNNYPVIFALRDGRDCSIRLMIEDDAAELCEVFPKTHLESDFLNWLPGEFQLTVEEERKFLRDTLACQPSIGLVVVVDGRIIAMGGAQGQARKRYKHHAEFGLTVLKAYWGMGIGRKIMETLDNWARAAGLRKATLCVFHDNAGAIGLYRSLDFIDQGRLIEHALRADGTFGDVIMMAKFYEQ